MESGKITLTKEKETLLITLFAKAGESQFQETLLSDSFAADAVRRIDYDFGKLKVTGDMMVGIAIRAKTLDDWVRTFIASHPGGCVLHLGCGLDTRVFRIDPPSGVRWFDVDYPEVIALRRRLYPVRPGCELIGSSVIDPAWLERVPADRPIMVVAEGLLMYLRKDEVQQLFSGIVERFPAGEMAFDAFSRLGVWFVQRQPAVRATGATLQWGIEDARDLERLVPRMKFVAEVPAYDRSYLDRFSFAGRMSIKAMLAIPILRRLGRFLRYRFEGSTRGPGRCSMQSSVWDSHKSE